MNKYISWTVTLKICGSYEQITCTSKKEAVHKYIDLLNAPWYYHVSELKIYKDGIDYTKNLNRFLGE